MIRDPKMESLRSPRPWRHPFSFRPLSVVWFCGVMLAISPLLLRAWSPISSELAPLSNPSLLDWSYATPTAASMKKSQSDSVETSSAIDHQSRISGENLKLGQTPLPEPRDASLIADFGSSSPVDSIRSH